MDIKDLFDSQAIALNYTTAASNSIPYLGAGLFPAKKKAGLDLTWFRGHSGLPVPLAPSTFDTKSTFRDRVGIKKTETEMPFFRESMLVKEKDEQEVMRILDANDPYAASILERILDDVGTLTEAADVVPERMIMQLLCPLNGVMGIQTKINGVDYTYNYDPKSTWKKEHYMKIEGEQDKWTASATCDPYNDLDAAIDALEEACGSKPSGAIMSKKTFKMIRESEKFRKYVLAQNPNATVIVNDDVVKRFIKDQLGIDIYVYAKKFKDESGKAQTFYKDNGVMLIPDGTLGNTWYGTTPEERTLTKKSDADVSIVNTGVAVAVTITDDPVNTKTTVSEIVLPSFERMDECYFLEVA